MIYEKKCKKTKDEGRTGSEPDEGRTGPHFPYDVHPGGTHGIGVLRGDKSV